MTTNQDEQYLQILSIFHYVVGGLTALFACFPILHLIVGLGILTGGFGPPLQMSHSPTSFLD